MTDKNTGGPAFPCEYEGSTRSDAYGMTLRDYFAARVMAATIAVPEYLAASIKKGRTYEEALRQFAGDAYKAADAMLEARQS
ncbi:MAG: hypothetical protein U1D65_12835 [Pseudomonas sp.]|nr:hypothetical protein [Pseudomonas sp.]MDZ4192886.1 hypothetical protein [Pseudomonas sp.]